MCIFFIPSLEICCSEDGGASVEYLDADGGLFFFTNGGCTLHGSKVAWYCRKAFLYSYMAVSNEIARNLPLRFATSWNSTAPSVTVLTWSDCHMIRQVFCIQARFAKHRPGDVFMISKFVLPVSHNIRKRQTVFFVSHDHLCCKSWPQTGEINAKLENQLPPQKIPHRNTFLTWHFPRIS